MFSFANIYIFFDNFWKEIQLANKGKDNMTETAYRFVLVCDEAAWHSNLCFLGIEFLFDDDDNRLGKEVGRDREIEALKTVTIAISRFNSLSQVTMQHPHLQSEFKSNMCGGS